MSRKSRERHPMITLPPQERDEHGRLLYSPRSNVGLAEEVDSPPGTKRGELRPRRAEFTGHRHEPSSISIAGTSVSVVGGRVPVLGSHQADA